MQYQYVATSVAGFVQQLAVAYIAQAYYFYVAGWIPEHKAPVETDAKILAQYDLALSKWTRYRRRKAGAASVQYLRYDRFFVILATHGEHPFFAAEGRALRDIRINPIHFGGYSIGCRQGRGGGPYHASVRLERTTCQELKRRFEAVALDWSVEEIARHIERLPYEAYAPSATRSAVSCAPSTGGAKSQGLSWSPAQPSSCAATQSNPSIPDSKLVDRPDC
ncbi:MAG TPA: hypothetical protein PKM43_18870 [Verrucomicrobiota bacterium]|mgnify:CR=1 FL=1|nr:hypothetical protein [Verrucomicrobiota bacterium]HRZ35910.1 hypothetical protein [Candidatus Paceibacterota bacterium]